MPVLWPQLRCPCRGSRSPWPSLWLGLSVHCTTLWKPSQTPLPPRALVPRPGHLPDGHASWPLLLVARLRPLESPSHCPPSGPRLSLNPVATLCAHLADLSACPLSPALSRPLPPSQGPPPCLGQFLPVSWGAQHPTACSPHQARPNPCAPPPWWPRLRPWGQRPRGLPFLWGQAWDTGKLPRGAVRLGTSLPSPGPSLAPTS